MNELLSRFREKCKDDILRLSLISGCVALIIYTTDPGSSKKFILTFPWILNLILSISHYYRPISDQHLRSMSVFTWIGFVVGITFYPEPYMAIIWSFFASLSILLLDSPKLRKITGILFLPIAVYNLLYFVFYDPNQQLVDKGAREIITILYGIILLAYFSWKFFKEVFLILQERDAQFKLFRSILDNIPADIVAMNKDKQHLFVNKTAVKDPRIREFMLGKTVFEYCEARNKPLELALERDTSLNKVLEGGKEIEWEEDFKTPRGEISYIRRISPVKDEEDDIELLIAYGFEITERKKAEAKLKRSEEIQSAINYFAKSLFGQNTEEDIVWDIAENCIHYLGFEDCVIYLLDDSKEYLLQKAAYGAKGKAGRQILNQIEIPLGKGIVGSVAQKAKAEIVVDTSEDKRYILDDELRLSEIAVPIIGPEGVLGVIDSEHSSKGFYTQRHLEILEVIASLCANKLIKARADRLLLESKEKAEEATRAKSSFLSTMSHEIRTPMNAVIGISHLLLEDEPKESQIPSLKVLEFSSRHLLSLINDILDYSKIEAGKLSFESEAFDLQDLMLNLHKTFSFKARDKNIDLKLSATRKLDHKIKGDFVRLNQILTNLVGNALKFTDKGEVDFGYEIESRTQQESNLYFFVRDTGIGIPQDKIENIFEQFTQASGQTTREYGGTGLGLAICKKLVELQGGEIGLESELGKGTKFWFRLSFLNGELLSVKENKPKVYNWSKGSLKGMKVLLVEDNRVNVMVGKKYLKKWDIEVEVAENGQIAVDLISANNYDLILMDLNMPVMDGLSATENIRKIEGKYFSELPIIALTADVSENVKENILQSGMNDYLTKPFDPEDLFRSLSSHYQGSKSEKISIS
ncbi:MAG: ATP-binding protein [Bacteroidota bacterium]